MQDDIDLTKNYFKLIQAVIMQAFFDSHVDSKRKAVADFAYDPKSRIIETFCELAQVDEAKLRLSLFLRATGKYI